VPLLDILLRSPLKLPDWLTPGSTPKKATSCCGLEKFSIPPSSESKVIEDISPTPLKLFRSSILRLKASPKEALSM